MKNKHTILKLIGIVSSVWACCPATAAEPETLSFDPSVGVSVNGTAEVQRIFGGVVNGSTRDHGAEYIRELNLNSARAFVWGPGRPGRHFKTPWYAAQYGGDPVTREEAFEKWDAFFNENLGNFDALMEDWWERANHSDQLYQLELFKKWDVTDGIVLHTELDGSGDRHPEAVNQYYKAYLDTINAKVPELDIEFVQLQNEPNYSHWSGQFKTTEEAAEAYIRSFNRLDEFLRAEGYKTQLLGPCLSTSAFCSWSGWRDWSLPVLKEFNHINYFNYQLYGKGASEHLAWMSMVQAAGEDLRGVRPRGVITETNLTPSQIEASKSFRWEAEQLFMALENPDKFALRTFFLLAYPNLSAGKPSRTTNLLRLADGELKPTTVYWVYWVLSQTRGEMVWIDAPSDPSLKVIASKTPADAYAVSLFNHSGELKSARVRPAVDLNTSEVTARIAYVDASETTVHEERVVPVDSDGFVTVNMPAYAVSSLLWETPQAEEIKRRVEHREYFAAETALKLNGGEQLQIRVDDLPDASQMAAVRLGVTADDVLMAKAMEFTLNGQPFKIVWSAQPQDILSRFGGFPNTWSVEVPVPADLIQADNVIEIASPDASYKLMFASLVTREFPNESKASAAKSQSSASSAAGFSVGLRAPGNLIGGQAVPVELSVINSSNEAKPFMLDWKLPEGISVEADSLPRKIELQAGEEKTFKANLIILEQGEIQEDTMHFRVFMDGGKSRLVSQNVRIFPRLVAEPIEANSTDAAAEALRKTDPVYVYRADGTVATTYLGWNRENLYLLVSAEGAFEVEACELITNFWKSDSIEVFFDLGNEKGLSYDSNDFQLFFCAEDAAQGRAIAGRVDRIVRDDSVDYIPPREAEGIEVMNLEEANASGYDLVCVIPWATLSPDFMPHAGQQLGFDLGINRPTGQSFSDSIVGSKGKRHDRPASWGILTLGHKETALVDGVEQYSGTWAYCR